MSQPEMKPLPPGVDRISALPDEMLIHILSFLPTKFAFATTVLSKRWTPLFHSLTAFNFDDRGVKGTEACRSFSRFVDKVLLSPLVPHHPIKTFCLMSRNKGFKVDEWVEATTRRGVENLVLDLTASPWTLLLSPRIFTSPTLVVLKLNGFYMGFCKFESIELPSLKTLHLTKTTFTGRENFKKLLSGCPNLVDLYAPVKFFDDGYPTGYKTLPKLEKACIYAFDIPFGTVYNVKFLRIEMMQRRCSDEYIDSYYRKMPVLHNLISIELCWTWGCFSGWARVVEVLSYCPKLQTLAIEKHGHDQIYNDKWEEPVPECVSLHLTTCSIRNYQTHGTNDVDDFKFAAYIMQNARLLQLMTLHIDRNLEEYQKDRLYKLLYGCPRISQACKIECKYSS